MKIMDKHFHLTWFLLLVVLPVEVNASIDMFGFIGRLICYVPLFNLLLCNDCAFHNNPCGDGGTCQDEIGSYTCTCETGWTGTNCDVPYEEFPAWSCSIVGVTDVTSVCQAAVSGINA